MKQIMPLHARLYDPLSPVGSYKPNVYLDDRKKEWLLLIGSTGNRASYFRILEAVLSGSKF